MVELALVESQCMDTVPMNLVIHHIENPPGLTPPRLLAGGREGKVLYVEVNIMLYMNHVIQDIDTPPRLLPGGGGLVSLSYHPQTFLVPICNP